MQLYEKYGGIKSINIVEGKHNTQRQKHLVNKIVSFFDKYLNGNGNKEKEEEDESESENDNNGEEEDEEREIAETKNK